MIGRKGVAAAQALEPHRGAELLDELDQRLCRRRPGRRRRRRRWPGSSPPAAAVVMAAMPAGSGRVAAKEWPGLPAGMLVSCSMTLIGSATNTGPAGASLAILKARCRIGPSSSARLDLHAPLGDGRRDGRKVVAQHGIAQPQPRVLLARRHHHRRVVLQRAVDHADGVAEARRHVEVHEGRLAARLGVEVRRTGRHAFVQMHDVLDLRIVEQRVEQRALGRAGIAEDAIDAVIEQRLEEHLTTAHGISPRAFLSRVGPAIERAEGEKHGMDGVVEGDHRLGRAAEDRAPRPRPAELPGGQLGARTRRARRQAGARRAGGGRRHVRPDRGLRPAARGHRQHPRHRARDARPRGAVEHHGAHADPALAQAPDRPRPRRPLPHLSRLVRGAARRRRAGRSSTRSRVSTGSPTCCGCARSWA